MSHNTVRLTTNRICKQDHNIGTHPGQSLNVHPRRWMKGLSHFSPIVKAEFEHSAPCRNSSTGQYINPLWRHGARFPVLLLEWEAAGRVECGPGCWSRDKSRGHSRLGLKLYSLFRGDLIGTRSICFFYTSQLLESQELQEDEVGSTGMRSELLHGREPIGCSVQRRAGAISPAVREPVRQRPGLTEPTAEPPTPQCSQPQPAPLHVHFAGAEFAFVRLCCGEGADALKRTHLKFWGWNEGRRERFYLAEGRVRPAAVGSCCLPRGAAVFCTDTSAPKPGCGLQTAGIRYGGY